MILGSLRSILISFAILCGTTANTQVAIGIQGTSVVSYRVLSDKSIGSFRYFQLKDSPRIGKSGSIHLGWSFKGRLAIFSGITYIENGSRIEFKPDDFTPPVFLFV